MENPKFYRKNCISEWNVRLVFEHKGNMKNQLIQAETLAKVMDEGGEKNTLREIFSFANYCLSDGRDNKVYLWENNMRELLKSKRSRVFHEGKQVNGIFFIEVRYRNINFIHVSPNRWWKK